MAHDATGLPRGTVLEYRAVADGGEDGTSGASAVVLAGVDLQGRGGDAVVLAGTDSDPAWSARTADGADLLLHEPESGSYIRAGERPAGTSEFLALPRGDWALALGRDGTPEGAPYSLEHAGGALTQVFDPASDNVVDSARGLYTIAGSWNTTTGSDRYGTTYYWGLRGDALDQVLSDPDGDGVWTVALDVPAGTYQVKVAQDLRTDAVTYTPGPGDGPRDPEAVSMEHPGGVVTFVYDAAADALTWTLGDHTTTPAEPTEPTPEPTDPAPEPEPTPEPTDPAPEPEPTPEPTDPAPEPEPTPGPEHDEALVSLAAGNIRTDPTTDFRVPAGAEVFSGDWDGDGVDTLAWRDGNLFTFTSANADDGGELSTMWYGLPSDEVFVGDWDGNGTDTITVRRGNQFHVSNSLRTGNADSTFWYGTPDDEPVAGDWDGDGVDTFAVRRGNEIHLRNSLTTGNADRVIHYGKKGEVILAGDLDGDGVDTLVIHRRDQFHLKFGLGGGNADRVTRFGQIGDVPVLGDWDGDGKDTIGVVRPESDG